MCVCVCYCVCVCVRVGHVPNCHGFVMLVLVPLITIDGWQQMRLAGDTHMKVSTGQFS